MAALLIGFGVAAGVLGLITLLIIRRRNRIANNLPVFHFLKNGHATRWY